MNSMNFVFTFISFRLAMFSINFTIGEFVTRSQSAVVDVLRLIPHTAGTSSLSKLALSTKRLHVLFVFI